MNKLNTFLSFVLLSFCLLINVSNALEFEPNVNVSSYVGHNYRVALDMYTNITSSYTFNDVYSIAQTYWTDQSNESDFVAMKNSVLSSGYTIWFGKATSNPFNFVCYVWKDTECDVGARINPYSGAPTPYVACIEGDYLYFYDLANSCYFEKFNDVCLSMQGIYWEGYPDYKYGVGKIKSLPDGAGGTRVWDGVSYYEPYNVSDTEPIEPDTPSLPSNSEIASAVQAFYNSDYYKNNNDFKDFIVLLNTTNNNISIIGHNFASQLAQCIVPADYEYDGESYNQDWWRFYLRGITDQISATLLEKYYWLYNTTDLGETITYTGKGYMNDLLDVRFTTQSIIIYSTTDYFVQTFEKDDEGIYQPESGTIPGNQYTYDETLDPTENQYNPLDTFVPTNPSQTILGDVDFDEINKIFEENKDILNIEGASWLFTANNKLVGYFIGFLSLLIVFLIISRILGG